MGDSIYSYPEHTVETKYGKAYLWSTGRDHIGFREEDGDYFVVNGVPMTARVDLHRREESGIYRPGTDDSPYQYFSAFIGSRVGQHGGVSDSARRKILLEAQRVVTEFMATDEGKAFVLTGEAKRLAQEAVRYERDLVEAEGKLAEIRSKIADNQRAQRLLREGVTT